MNWSQAVLAKKSGLSIQMIKDIERERSPGGAKSFQLLADAFAVSVDEILGKSPIEEPRINTVTLPPSKTLQMYMSLPDDIVELAAKFGSKHDLWEEVRAVFEDHLIELEESKKKNKKA